MVLVLVLMFIAIMLGRLIMNLQKSRDLGWFSGGLRSLSIGFFHVSRGWRLIDSGRLFHCGVYSCGSFDTL
ncbi:hypothetical protein DFH27DRAFT_553157 [Peziza echinospora]|nr:hypothetical protein DFH27DRAFT_553157 [Peziza echinospora]